MKRSFGKTVKISSLVNIITENYENVIIYIFFISGLMIGCEFIRYGKNYFQFFDLFSEKLIYSYSIMLFILTGCLIVYSSGFSYLGSIEIPILILFFGMFAGLYNGYLLSCTATVHDYLIAESKIFLSGAGLSSIQLLSVHSFNFSRKINKSVTEKDEFSAAAGKYTLVGIIMIMLCMISFFLCAIYN